MLQPSLAGADCPSVVETAAASVFTHLDPAVRRVWVEHLQGFRTAIMQCSSLAWPDLEADKPCCCVTTVLLNST